MIKRRRSSQKTIGSWEQNSRGSAATVGKYNRGWRSKRCLDDEDAVSGGEEAALDRDQNMSLAGPSRLAFTSVATVHSPLRVSLARKPPTFATRFVGCSRPTSSFSPSTLTSPYRQLHSTGRALPTPDSMRCILIKDGKGPASNLYMGEEATPQPKAGEVQVKASLVPLFFMTKANVRSKCVLGTSSGGWN